MPEVGRRPAGRDYFGHVAVLNLGNDATDVEMAAVRATDPITRLRRDKAKVTEAPGWSHLRGLTDLEKVYLGDSMLINTGLTGASLAQPPGDDPPQGTGVLRPLPSSTPTWPTWKL